MLRQEINNRKLPKLFETADGLCVSDYEGWEQKMRPYWRKTLLDNVFGNLPPYIKPQISVSINRVNFAGKATWEDVVFQFEYNGMSHSVPTRLVIPKTPEKPPMFIYVDFDSHSPSKYLPAEEILDNGFGFFAVCYNDVTKDNPDFTDGLAGLFASKERKPDEAGKIIYWAYMAMQMMDYLQTRDDINCNAIGIAGHSRLGKTALLTAALDERFAFTCPNCSGCTGVNLCRGCDDRAETVEILYGKYPYWFCENYSKYKDDPFTLPHDQHCLIALVAPRAVFVGAGIEDVYADTNGQYMACVAASPAWELYGKSGFVHPNRYPVVGDNFDDGEIGFHLRAGDHFHSRLDWQIYMESVTKYLKNRKVL